jgi:hypothetical protein
MEVVTEMANVLTNVGKAIVTGRLLNTPPGGGAAGSAAPRFVGWGTGTTAAAATQTALVTEASETSTTRVTGTETRDNTGGQTNDTYVVTGTVQATGSKNISEAGLFDSVTGGSGNMFIRGDFTAVPLLSGDSIAFTFKWTIS